MISDVLFEAAEEIKNYLKKTSPIYGGDLRDRIVKLVAEMDEIRMLPGMDTPPDRAAVALFEEKQLQKEQNKKAAPHSIVCPDGFPLRDPNNPNTVWIGSYEDAVELVDDLPQDGREYLIVPMGVVR